MALTHNGLVLPYMHFDARSRQTSRDEVIGVLAEETYAKVGVLTSAGASG